MAKTKKPLDEAFRSAVSNTLGRRSAYDVARDAGLPHQSIARVLEGTNPELSRAIEIANALGFEICYEWPRDKKADQVVAGDKRGGGEVDVFRMAIRLAVGMKDVMAPQYRELTEHPQFWPYIEGVVLSYENMVRELGPGRTGDPSKTYDALFRVIEMQKAERPDTDD